MREIVLIAISCLLLAACDTEREAEVYQSNTTETWKLPDELKDCKMWLLESKGGVYIRVMRCPNSTTTTKSGGKFPKTITVIE